MAAAPIELSQEVPMRWHRIKTELSAMKPPVDPEAAARAADHAISKSKP